MYPLKDFRAFQDISGSGVPGFQRCSTDFHAISADATILGSSQAVLGVYHGSFVCQRVTGGFRGFQGFRGLPKCSGTIPEVF